MKLCTIATVEINDYFRRTIRSLRATGSAEPVMVYVPDGYGPPDIEGLDCEVVKCGNWWRDMPGAIDRANTPALCKPEIMIDSRWPDGDRVLYFDSSDILFFADPATFFDWPADQPLAAYPFTQKNHAIAGDIRTPPTDHYNSGVIGFIAGDQARRFGAVWLALLQSAVATNLHKRHPSRPLAGDQVSLSAAIWLCPGRVAAIPHEWNYRGGTMVRKAKIRDGKLIGKEGPVLIAHATGGGKIPEKIVKAALHGAPGPTPAPVAASNFDPAQWTCIIPAFRAADYIADCIESIPAGVAVMIGCDGCPETAAAIPARNGLRVFMFSAQTYPYRIRNTLAEMVESGNIMFFDSDDYFLEGGFAAAAGLMTDGADCVRYMCRMFEHGSPGKFRDGKTAMCGQFAVRREKFMALNGFQPWRCAADREFQLRAEAAGYKTATAPGFVFARRHHPGQLTRDAETNMRSALRAAYHKQLKDNLSIPRLPVLATAACVEVTV